MSDIKKNINSLKNFISDQLFGLLVVTFGIFIGIVLMWQGVEKIVQYLNSDELEKGHAIIANTYYETTTSNSYNKNSYYTVYLLFAQIDITINGISYRGNVKLAECSEVETMHNIFRRFPENGNINIFYNPDDPSEMHLNNDLPIITPILTFLMGMTFLASCSIGFINYIKMFINWIIIQRNGFHSNKKRL